MPGDSKKNDKKNAKEQRKPRQRHQQQAKTDIKPEKPEELMNTPNVTVLQKPPVYESPPPEFYKNLKRETDEVLKITEEENSKYKKKEIQSNWSKYEMPIETYDEIDEQENLGADYEKLIEAPLSVGGHFQFKHERSWDMNIGPSQYDKYFEINMEDLNVALCTIPFYERNYIKQNEFNESDILSMNNRCTRFKQKYFNDKSYASPESEVQDKILNSLQDSNNKNNEIEDTEKYSKDIVINMENENSDIVTIKAEDNLEVTRDPVTDSNNTIEKLTMKMTQEADYSKKAEETSALDDIVNDDFIFRNTEKTIRSEHSEPTNMISDIVPQVTVKETPLVNRTADIVESKVPVIDGSKVAASVETKVTKAVSAVSQSPVDTKKNPVIESPEDLEKWLDDFLDG